MKYKIGDRVRVRQWKAMEREYGLDDFGDIKIPIRGFASEMREFCGMIATIDDVRDNYYKLDIDGHIFYWVDEMFEGYAFEYGDKIEVSNNGFRWQKVRYVEYIDGIDNPYVAVRKGAEEFFERGRKFGIEFWKYARPIQKGHKIIIDDKEIEISEESYKKLRESLLNE